MACRCPPVCSRTLLPGTFVIGILLCLLLFCPAATAAENVRTGLTINANLATTAATQPPVQTVTCTAPCECLLPSEVSAKWGTSYSRCSPTACSYATDASGARTAKYCYKQNAAPPAPATASRAGITRVATTQFPVRADTLPAAATTTPELPVISSTLTRDSDGDGLADIVDNCPASYNPGQTDSNRNGIGDACDTGSGQFHFNDTDNGGNDTGDAGDSHNAGNYSPDSEKNLAPLKVNVGHVEFRAPFEDWFHSLYSFFSGGK